MSAGLTVEPLAIPAVRLVRLALHHDARGSFSETWNRAAFAAAGLDADFVQDNESRSLRPGTVRGLHYQLAPAAQGKLVRVVQGRIRDVAVDLRRGAASFAGHVAVELTAAETIVQYKVDAPYRPDLQRGIRWDDPDLAIDWPVTAATAVLSDRDAGLPVLAAADL